MLLTEKKERWFLLALAGIQFTHILDFMILMPLAPQLLRQLNISTHAFGLLVSAYTLSAALSSLLATTFIDRFDRRRLLLGLYLAFIAATLFCGLAANYSILLFARCLTGVFGGILGALVQTMIADTIPFERRGRAMGIVMSAFSLSTIAGVPLGLFLATHIESLSWRAPFFLIVILSSIFWIVGQRMLPSLTAHMQAQREQPMLQHIWRIFKQPNHLWALAFVLCILLSSFTVIPYIALYLTSNVGLPEKFLTLIYLFGGAATFVSAPVIGRLADKFGKRRIYRIVAALSFIPLLITTHLTPVAWWLVLINTSLFFILISGRMIPGMAMVTASAPLEVRGAFMGLVSAMQMLAAGLASLITGLIISKNSLGQVVHYNYAGYLAVVFGLLSIWLVGKLKFVGREDATRVN